MSKTNSVRVEDLMGILFRSNTEDFPFEKTFGKWYAFLNSERGIGTSKNSDHRWLRIAGIKLVGKGKVKFDASVEPIFLRSTIPGSPPDCVDHDAHPHASPAGCILNLDAFVWINVNRSMEPGIRDYEKTSILDGLTPFCIEDDPAFLKRFIYWLGEEGAEFDFSGAGL